jgi:hypothetical protein
VQVLCGASWKQPQAEGNCTQVGASRDNPAWRREAVWGRSRRRAAAPNVSEALCRPGRSGERAKERDAQNPTEIGAVLGPGAAVHPVSLPWEVSMGPRRAPIARERWGASGRPEGGNDDRPTSMQKSDLFVGAWKLVKAGGAKGEMD